MLMNFLVKFLKEFHNIIMCALNVTLFVSV